MYNYYCDEWEKTANTHRHSLAFIVEIENTKQLIEFCSTHDFDRHRVLCASLVHRKHGTTGKILTNSKCRFFSDIRNKINSRGRCSNSKKFETILKCLSALVMENWEKVWSNCVATLKTKPKFLAALTRAPSSGDWAWYSRTPERKRKTSLLIKYWNRTGTRVSITSPNTASMKFH